METLTVRRIGVEDFDILAVLAREDADFDVAGRGAPLPPLEGSAADRYLANPSLQHWVAEDRGKVLGFLCGYALPLRSGKGDEFLLYEIGVREAYRRKGVGKTLLSALFGWMDTHRVKTVWVIADNPSAVEFYRGCGFKVVEGTLTQMELDRPR